MSVQFETRSAPADITEQYAQYKALSVLAVASTVLGVLSIATALNWALALIPALGIVTGLIALRRVKSNPAELTGAKFATTGIALSALFMATGFGYLTYDYITELPPGYERLSYSQLQPDVDKPGEVYPPEITEYDGHRIFIKGYVYPGKQTTGIKEFVLCRDNGDCCFGGQPRLTDRIMVRLKGPLALNYSTKLQRLAGTFHVQPGQAVDGIGGAIYHLDADYLK